MRAFTQKQNSSQKPRESSSLIRPHKRASTLNHGIDARSNVLQHTVGDQGVQRSHIEDLARGFTSIAPSRFGYDFSRIPIYPPTAGAMQAKLTISKPGDEYEQEANRVAERVMRMPEPELHRACPCGGLCSKCQTSQLGQKHERLQTKRVQASDTGQIAAPPSVHDVLRSPGQPLDPVTRGFMEPRFGHDFSRVRVHSGAAAEQSAREVSANAYTVGHDVVFGTGQFAPRTQAGRRLLAHELTHVAQNVSGGELPVIRRAPAPDLYEIISPVWNVGGRDVVIVRMKADGRVFFFYRRSGSGSKGRFDLHAPPKDAWVPFEGFEEVEKLGKPRTYRFHKEPYYYAPAVKEGRVAPGYGTQMHKDIAEWLDNELPSGKIKSEAADWGDVQKELEKHSPRNLPFPGEEAPQQAISKSGEIGGPDRPGSGPSGGGTVEVTVEETTERIVKHVPTVPQPKVGFRARLSAAKSGFKAGLKSALKSAFSAANIASEIPDVILAVADKVAAREAIRTIEIKFTKEGFAKGVAAGVTGWSEEEVGSNLKNRVTPFRVKGLKDPAGFLTLAYILQLAEAYENYAVDLGYQFSSSKPLSWKKDMTAKGWEVLTKYGYHFGGDPEVYLFEYNFIDKLAYALHPITDRIVEEAIEEGEERREAELRRIEQETGAVGMKF